MADPFPVDRPPRLRYVVANGAKSIPGAASPDRRMDFAEAAARCQLRDVVESVTVCLTAETPVSEIRRLFHERDLRAVPVVDNDLRLIGIVSRSDLVSAAPGATARDVMPSTVHALPEHAPISFAIALMGLERVSEVPVVTDDGEVVGLLHALDALRWIARRIGYVMTRDCDAHREANHA